MGTDMEKYSEYAAMLNQCDKELDDIYHDYALRHHLSDAALWITLEKEIILEDDWSNATLMLTGVDASALTLNVDGLFAGYVYGADWSLNGMNLAAGSHVLTVTLYNSGYNIHGPHHYYLGDYSLVSPLHIKGEKHFGDLPDAPINTHIPEWHFVNYRLFGSVHLLQKQLREE